MNGEQPDEADSRQGRVTFSGQVAQDYARQHVGHNYTYATSYSQPRSSSLGSFFTQRKRNKELLEAAKNGYTQRVQMLLRNGADIDYKDSDGRIALHLAAWWGHDDIVKTLLDAGSVLNLCDGQGWTPLQMAASQAKAHVVRTLLSTPGIRKDVADQNGDTPLSWAITWVYNDVIKALVEGGCDVDLSRDFHRAVSNSSYEIVRMLLSCPRVEKDAFNRNGLTALHVAAKGGDVSMVKILLENDCCIDAQLDDRHATPLHVAVIGSNIAAVKTLVEGGASVFTTTAIPKDSRLVDKLAFDPAYFDDALDRYLDDVISRNIPPFINDQTPLELARCLHRSEIIAYLEGVEASQVQSRPGASTSA